MADEKTKTSPINAFKQKLSDKDKLVATIKDGLTSTNAKVRALAIKWAHKTQEHEFVKKHVMPLLKDEKTKRVYKTVAKKINRSAFIKKLEELKKAIPTAKAAKKDEAATTAEQK